MVMENYENFESQEVKIERLIDNLAQKEEMDPNDIISDIVTFAPYEDNETSNPEYFEEVAERLEISLDELNAYAVKKAKDYLGE
jgi:hypothetical protein